MMDTGINRRLLIDKLHMLLNSAINEQDEGLLTDLICAGMDIDAITESMADGVICLRNQEINLIDKKMRIETIKRVTTSIEKLNKRNSMSALPEKIYLTEDDELAQIITETLCDMIGFSGGMFDRVKLYIASELSNLEKDGE